MTWFKIYYRKWRKKSPWKHIWDICGRFYSHKIYKTKDFDDVRIRTQSYKSYLIFYFSNDNKWWQYNEFRFTLIRISRKILIFEYVECNEKYFTFLLEDFYSLQGLQMFNWAHNFIAATHVLMSAILQYYL